MPHPPILDPVAAFVAALVVFHGGLALFALWDRRCVSLCLSTVFGTNQRHSREADHHLRIGQPEKIRYITAPFSSRESRRKAKISGS